MSKIEQRTPDELSQNELICERLLGWKRGVRGCISNAQFWDTGGLCDVPTPSFTTWAEAGLILEALQQPERWTATSTLTHLSQLLDEGHLTPAAVRTASLSYVRSRL